MGEIYFALGKRQKESPYGETFTGPRWRIYMTNKDHYGEMSFHAIEGLNSNGEFLFRRVKHGSNEFYKLKKWVAERGLLNSGNGQRPGGVVDGKRVKQMLSENYQLSLELERSNTCRPVTRF